MSQKGLLKRFSMTCYGKQPTLESMRAEKTRQFELLKKKRDSYEYQRLFLKYHPTRSSVDKPSRFTRKAIQRKDTPKSKTPKKSPAKKTRKAKKGTPKGFVFKLPLRKNWLY